MKRPCLSSEAGQTLPIAVLFLLVLLGIAALVLDGGYAYAQQRFMRNASDAASLAATALIANGETSHAVIYQTAWHYAQANQADSIVLSYVDGSGNDLGGPVGGSIPPGTKGARVIASRTFTTFFGTILGVRQMTATAGSTGGVRPKPANALIIALDQGSCPGLRVSGSGSVNAVGGSIWVNASCGQALRQTGSTSITATGGQILVHGGYSRSGSGTINPYPTTYGPVIPDPLASLPAPDWGGLPVRNGTPSNPTTLHITGSGSVTLQPGIYYGGIRFDGSGTVTFQPGTYIIAGGGLTLIGSGSVYADGVMFYNTNDPAHPTGSGAYGSITITGSGSWRFRPQTSGPYAGILFFQDRANTQEVEITGSGNMLSGTMYFPNADLDFAGSGNISGVAQLIAKSIDMTGSGDITLTYDTGGGLYGVPNAAIIQ